MAKELQLCQVMLILPVEYHQQVLKAGGCLLKFRRQVLRRSSGKVCGILIFYGMDYGRTMGRRGV